MSVRPAGDNCSGVDVGGRTGEDTGRTACVVRWVSAGVSVRVQPYCARGALARRSAGHARSLRVLPSHRACHES
jgi:hypothetical protein